MIAAGWDTARNVAVGVATLWIVVFGAFCALGCLYDYRQRQRRADDRHRVLIDQARADEEAGELRAQDGTVLTDDDVIRLLTRDVDRIIERTPELPKRQRGLDETEVDTWIGQIHAADPADIPIHAVTDRRLLRRPR